MHHRLQAGSDRLESGQPQQVHRCRAQGGHHSGTVTPVAVGILMELGAFDPVPALNAPAVAYQLQQCFWRSAQARQEQVGGVKGHAVTGTCPTTIR